MGADNATAIIARTKAVLEAVVDAGRVLDHIPGWRTPEEMDEDGLFTLANGSREHRFWFIEHQALREALTNQSDLVTHNMDLTGWIAAKQDKDQFEVCTATVHALKSLVVAAFDSAKIAYPNIAGEQLTYEDEGRVEESAPPEFRHLLGVDFHIIQIRVAPREEITRG